MHVIDISWVSLCVPMRPGKNFFVMIRGARRLHGWYAACAGARWLHSAATNQKKKKEVIIELLPLNMIKLESIIINYCLVVV